MTIRREYLFGEQIREGSLLTFIMETAPKIYTYADKRPVILRKAFFLCECGNTTESYITDVKLGKSSCCGCKGIEKSRERWTTHGNSGHPLYYTWWMMQQRCYNPKNKKYYLYGSAGIKVCDRWLGDAGFKKFVDDMGEKPADDFTVDRIDSSGDYSPNNCRWADKTTQGYNKRMQSTNTSGAVGVSYDKFNKKWMAYIKKGGRHKTLGRFSSFKEAVRVRRDAEIEVYGYNNNYSKVTNATS